MPAHLILDQIERNIDLCRGLMCTGNKDVMTVCFLLVVCGDERQRIFLVLLFDLLHLFRYCLQSIYCRTMAMIVPCSLLLFL